MRQCWFAFFFVAAACGQQTDAPVVAQAASDNWKRSYTPAECKALTEEDAYMRRCFPGVDTKAPHYVEAIDDKDFVGEFKCMPYSPPRRLAGVWVIGLESSRFYPQASTYDETVNRSEKIWLETDEPVPPEVTEAGQGAGTRAYAIDFIGRRSLCEWHYGHFGMSPHEVVAQRILSLQPLPLAQH